METIHGAESWRLANEVVSLHVTKTAAMIAPVEFTLGSRTVSPYALAPWRPDEIDEQLPALLKFLRGDFFCLPFGPQADGPPHGASANESWEKIASSEDSVLLKITDPQNGAVVEKRISIQEGHGAIYYDYRISNLDGNWSYGNHPILDASGAADGEVRLSVSPFRWASVYPGMFSDPEQNEFQALRPAARFDQLASVPRFDNSGLTDLTRWPARAGSDDLVMMVSQPATTEQPFAWSAAVFDDYVWFSLKKPEDFPSTLFWMSNGGRRGAPWNASHTKRIGIEEVCSHFSDGIDISREDRLVGENIPTTRCFSRDEEVSLRIVQAVAAVPNDFGVVAEILPAGPGKVLIVSDSGIKIDAEVDWNYVL